MERRAGGSRPAYLALALFLAWALPAARAECCVLAGSPASTDSAGHVGCCAADPVLRCAPCPAVGAVETPMSAPSAASVRPAAAGLNAGRYPDAAPPAPLGPSDGPLPFRFASDRPLYRLHGQLLI